MTSRDQDDKTLPGPEQETLSLDHRFGAEEPPAALDARILRAAHEAVRPQDRGFSQRAAWSLAASLLLCTTLALTWFSRDDSALTDKAGVADPTADDVSVRESAPATAQEGRVV